MDPREVRWRWQGPGICLGCGVTLCACCGVPTETSHTSDCPRVPVAERKN